jgi:hypothetical protein
VPLRVAHRRAPAPVLLFDLPATSTPALTEQLAAAFRPDYQLGLLSPDRVQEVSELLVDSFFLADAAPLRPDGSSGRRPTAKGTTSREERLRLTARGLEWRLGPRLQSPDLSLSLESSLLLALSEKRTGQLAACAELSLRPRTLTRPSSATVPTRALRTHRFWGSGYRGKTQFWRGSQDAGHGGRPLAFLPAQTRRVRASNPTTQLQAMAAGGWGFSLSLPPARNPRGR